MKSNILFGSVLAAALSVGAAAQSTPPQTPPTGSSGAGSMQSPTREQGSTRGSTVTVTGCLQSASGSPSATGTSGSTGAAGASTAGSFILANATTGAAGGAMGAPAGTSGAAPSAGASTAAGAAAGSQFKLMGGNKDDLQKYVNSKVEIRGKIDSSAGSAASASPSPSSPGASPSASASGSSSSDKTLQVESVRQVAASCSN